jgi:hypothetical protein
MRLDVLPRAALFIGDYDSPRLETDAHGATGSLGFTIAVSAASSGSVTNRVGLAKQHFENVHRMETSPSGEDLRFRNFIAKNGLAISVVLCVAVGVAVVSIALRTLSNSFVSAAFPLHEFILICSSTSVIGMIILISKQSLE